MTSSVTNPVKAFALIALGLAITAMGIYVAHADDTPGAAVIGFLLMLAAVLFGVRTARNQLPIWAGRTALAVGVLIAAFAAFLTHAVTVAAPLFAQPPDVPPVSGSAGRRLRHNGRQRPIARGRLCARPSWSRTCQESRSRSAWAWASSGPKGSDGGTWSPRRPSPRRRDSTSAPQL